MVRFAVFICVFVCKRLDFLVVATSEFVGWFLYIIESFLTIYIRSSSTPYYYTFSVPGAVPRTFPRLVAPEWAPSRRFLRTALNLPKHSYTQFPLRETSSANSRNHYCWRKTSSIRRRWKRGREPGLSFRRLFNT